MTLGEAQRTFTFLVGRLIVHAYQEGYALTLGDAYRDPRATFPYAPKKRLHQKRLAVDLNLFEMTDAGVWVYQTTSRAWEPLGTWWREQHELARWGGDFRPDADPNHLSLEWQGMK